MLIPKRKAPIQSQSENSLSRPGCCRAALFLLLLLLGAGPAHAASELEVKAAFLFNFTKFVEWPAESFTTPAGPVVLGLVGQDPLAEVLPKVIEHQSVKGRPIEI